MSMERPKYLFGDIVVIEGGNIGIVVKTWERQPSTYYYEVYVRVYNSIKEYDEDDIERYRVRHKYLSDEDREYQNAD